MSNRGEFLQRMEKERERHIDDFGREFDAEKTPNDWIATIVHYASEHITKKGIVAPYQEDFEDLLIKAGAVILAALENISKMSEKNCFKMVDE